MPSRANWIESHTDLRHHPKLKPTADALQISPATLCGHLHFLWHWILDYQDDGDVTRYSNEILENAACWEGPRNAFVTQLQEFGWLDVSPRNGRKTVHNWPSYVHRLLRYRALTKARVAKHREKTRAVTLDRTVPTVPYVKDKRETRERVGVPTNGSGHPGSVEEVRAYWAEATLSGDPAKFYDHFQASGWKMRAGPVKDWKAAARNWSRNDATGLSTGKRNVGPSTPSRFAAVSEGGS